MARRVIKGQITSIMALPLSALPAFGDRAPAQLASAAHPLSHRHAVRPALASPTCPQLLARKLERKGLTRLAGCSR